MIPMHIRNLALEQDGQRRTVPAQWIGLAGLTDQQLDQQIEATEAKLRMLLSEQARRQAPPQCEPALVSDHQPDRMHALRWD